MSSFGPIGSDLSHERPRSAGSSCRADLHVHSIHSGSGHLRAPRLRSGLPEPETLYRAARARGMALVTLTDLDTINGCVAFLDRHPDAGDFFISEEFSKQLWLLLGLGPALLAIAASASREPVSQPEPSPAA